MSAQQACDILAPLTAHGYEFEAAGQCVRVVRIPLGDIPVPYILAENILAETDPCRYVRQTLGGRA